MHYLHYRFKLKKSKEILTLISEETEDFVISFPSGPPTTLSQSKHIFAKIRNLETDMLTLIPHPRFIG